MENDLPKLRDYVLWLKQQQKLSREQKVNLLHIKHFTQIMESTSQYHKFSPLIKEISKNVNDIEFYCQQQDECEEAVVGLVKNNSYQFKNKIAIGEESKPREIMGNTVRLYLPHFNGFTVKEKEELTMMGIEKVKIYNFQMQELMGLTEVDKLPERDYKVKLYEE